MKELSKNEINKVRKLHQRKYRTDEHKFLAEGTKIVGEMLLSGWSYDVIYYVDGVKMPVDMDVSDSKVIEIGHRDMDRISTQSTAPGILAIISMPAQKPFVYRGPLVLVLNGISDPGNMGTIIRTADWFGVTELICTAGCVESFSPKVVHASMGSVFRVNINYMEENQIMESLEGVHILAAAADGDALSTISMDGKTALVIGSESHGISDEIKSLAHDTVSIPGAGSGVESLNAAVACGILLAGLVNR
jgi:RNA methyltransferase, TrmH family